jgi:hypothetical protein
MMTYRIALYEEGIFRISGNSKRLSLLQSIFDRAEEDYGLNIDWTGYSVHDAANLMSRYLNRLPQPIIILEYQNSFKNILGKIHSLHFIFLSNLFLKTWTFPICHQRLMDFRN